jgi:hypothetical protein
VTAVKIEVKIEVEVEAVETQKGKKLEAICQKPKAKKSVSECWDGFFLVCFIPKRLVQFVIHP